MNNKKKTPKLENLQLLGEITKEEWEALSDSDKLDKLIEIVNKLPSNENRSSRGIIEDTDAL